MKSCNRQNPLMAAIGCCCLSNIAVAARAFQYGWAAERDDRNGFPCTAAMEWRKAAELFSPNTRAAEYCWRQWERIMQLPRRLSGPIGISPRATIPWAAASVSRSIRAPGSDQVSFAETA